MIHDKVKILYINSYSKSTSSLQNSNNMGIATYIIYSSYKTFIKRLETSFQKIQEGTSDFTRLLIDKRIMYHGKETIHSEIELIIY